MVSSCIHCKIGYYLEITDLSGNSIIRPSIFWDEKEKDKYISKLGESLHIKHTEDLNMDFIVDSNDDTKFIIHTKTIYFYTDKSYDGAPENILFYIYKDDSGHDTNIIIGADSYDNLSFGLIKYKIHDDSQDKK